MNKYRTLRDAYRFPGFVPQATLRSIDVEFAAVVLPLTRRRKKRLAESAAEYSAASTTKSPGRSAIWIAATDTSIWNYSCDGFVAEDAVP